MSVIRCPHCGEAIEVQTRKAVGVAVGDLMASPGWAERVRRATDRAAAREYWHERRLEQERRGIGHDQDKEPEPVMDPPPKDDERDFVDVHSPKVATYGDERPEQELNGHELHRDAQRLFDRAVKPVDLDDLGPERAYVEATIRRLDTVYRPIVPHRDGYDPD